MYKNILCRISNKQKEELSSVKDQSMSEEERNNLLKKENNFSKIIGKKVLFIFQVLLL